MAKKKAGKKMQTTAEPGAREELAGEEFRHAQIKIPVDVYEDGKRIARMNGLSFNAYVRLALFQRIRSDKEELEGGAK